MDNAQKAFAIKKALEQTMASLEALAEAGQGVPAVERNVLRLQGSLKALDIQFSHASEPKSG